MKLLEDEGLLAPGATEARIRTSAKFYFGNRFAKICWEHEKKNDHDPEFVRMVDEFLVGLDDEENLRWLNQLKEDIKDTRPLRT